MSDQDLLMFLIELDKSDLNVSKWEADFINSILERRQCRFTPKQQDVILKMMDRYERSLP